MNARILYVPLFLAVEAERFAATVAEWAQVESFDVPLEGQVDAALARLDALRWSDCLVVADSHAQQLGVELALRHPQRVRGIALSHAAARYRVGGPRSALNEELSAAAERLLDTDYMAFLRAVTQLTQGGMPDAWVERWAARVPHEHAKELFDRLDTTQPPLAEQLAGFAGPILLGGHLDCLLWTVEGFEDAVAALPGARAVWCREIPAFDPAFGEALRELAAG